MDLDFFFAILIFFFMIYLCLRKPMKRGIPEEAAKSYQSFCEICMEGKPKEEMFRVKQCSHSFCSHCMGKHVEAKIQGNISKVTCPELNCKAVLEPHHLQSIIPDQVFVRWGNALCESSIPESRKFYCPYETCRAMLVADGGEVVRESECPYCHRLFCAQCKVRWHSGKSCKNFQKLNKDVKGSEDQMVIALAKKKQWQRCPNCTSIVEKKEGCIHMTCRCGSQFCYRCGSKWTPTHGGCRRA